MGREIKVSCPLGHECEATVNGVTNRCAWYTRLTGNNPNTGAPIDEWGCAMSWLPILLVENAHKTVQQTATLDTLKNIVADGGPRMIGKADAK